MLAWIASFIGKQPDVTPSTVQKNSQKSKRELLKVAFIGDSGVGKTSCLQTFKNKKFNDIYVATIGVDFVIETLENVVGYNPKLQLFDIAGPERFRYTYCSYF
jgi:GTPase SAR1 family protein